MTQYRGYLIESEIQELEAISKSGQSGARVAYYTKLAEFGVSYGDLALSVVLENKLSGRVANAFFVESAKLEGISVSPQQWNAVGDALMHADIQTRLNSNLQLDDGSKIYFETNYTTIKDYHEDVFSNLGGTVPDGTGPSINSWTAFAPVKVYGEWYWHQLLSQSALNRNAMGTIGLVGMWDYFTKTGDLTAYRWFTVVALPAFQALLADGSPAIFESEIENSHIVLGTHASDIIDIGNNVPAHKKSLVMALGGNDTIYLEGRSDYYDGGEGNDIFLSKIVRGDIVHGSGGTDTIDFSQDVFRVNVDINSGYSSATSGHGTSFFNSVEKIIGTNGDDVFKFSGNLASIRMAEINGANGFDSIDAQNISSSIFVDLGGHKFSGPLDVDVYGIEGFYSGSGSDTVIGSAGQDQLYGNAGNDFISGAAGDDIINGGSGNDRLFGGDGRDNIADDFGDNYVEGGSGDDLIITGSGNDTIRGDGGNDSIYAGSGNNQLSGGEGDDRISIGNGYSSISGGSGRDDFSIYGQSAKALILDFELGVDQISAGSRLSYSDTADGLLIIYQQGEQVRLRNISTTIENLDMYI